MRFVIYKTNILIPTVFILIMAIWMMRSYAFASEPDNLSGTSEDTMGISAQDDSDVPGNDDGNIQEEVQYPEGSDIDDLPEEDTEDSDDHDAPVPAVSEEAEERATEVTDSIETGTLVILVTSSDGSMDPGDKVNVKIGLTSGGWFHVAATVDEESVYDDMDLSMVIENGTVNASAYVPYGYAANVRSVESDGVITITIRVRSIPSPFFRDWDFWH